MARPKVLDEPKRQMAVALVASGMDEQKVSECMGCSQRTIRREREADDEFDRQLRQAKMSRSLRPLEAMRKAAQTNWRAAAWMIERDERWSRANKAKPGAIGQREVGTLVRELCGLISREVDDVMLSIRLDALVEQTIRQWAEKPTGRRTPTAATGLIADTKRAIATLTQSRDGDGGQHASATDRPAVENGKPDLAKLLVANIRARVAQQQLEVETAEEIGSVEE